MSTGERNTWRRAISRIWTKLRWFDPPMGRVHQPKNFWSEGTPCGRGSPTPTPGPILLVNSKSCLRASTAFLLCMVNFFDDNKKMGKKFFCSRTNCRSSTKYANGPKSTLLIKIVETESKTNFSYILVKGLMANFQFWGYPIIFWRGHRCKKNSGLFGYAIAKPTRNGLVTPRRKFSYILVKRLMANFQFRGFPIIFWRGHRCKKKFWDFSLTPMTPPKNDPITPKLKICH